MSKIKLTKGELKRQRDDLKQFRHYLPTLQLKKQQLQMKILEARRIIAQKQALIQGQESMIQPWIGLLVDARVDISMWLQPKNIVTKPVNIAGVNVPVFQSIEFEPCEYDLFQTPFWIDDGIGVVRDIVTLTVEIGVIERQIELLHQELRVTTQRVNLFEKVKIPECLENIRRIRIYLGDQMANAVGIGKVAKKKIELREALAA